ncbi:hypothetical protein F511_38272 [Dorcoceras hygrometricum]|uniref:DUF547 domain-containing protein n=1 Tax=Dorcoceras hygrometricum TaxID=472368 RepID=A0A2Z7A037_9LAMI|nr:hypothetical protein F511_38272 [Dorcoceras hygrometricum]
MPPVDCPSPAPAPRASRWKSSFEMIKEDDYCVLNVSPRPSGHENLPSSEELVTEIAKLEIEIARLEQYLLSLYRTAFQQHLPSISENHVVNGHQITVRPPLGFVSSDQLSHMMKLRIPKSYDDHHDQSSPTSALTGPNDLIHVATSKSSFGRVYKPNFWNTLYSVGSFLSPMLFLAVKIFFNREHATIFLGQFQEKKKICSRHRSLGDHLGNIGTNDDALVCPDRLSEEIVRCISSIYCKLANPYPMNKGYSASSTSSFCSSSTFSPRNLSGSWSPQCNDETTERCDFEAVKQENGPYAEMIEVSKICLDDETYSYAATMLQKFRSLVKNLENVDPQKMRREEKLAFWINIHNALAYLAYGTQNYIKSTSIVKAAYNVGGHNINAYDIQSSILGIRSHYSAPWLQTILSPGKKFKSGSSKHTYAIEYPEPLVHFALSSGAYSDPAVRLYKASTIFEDLKVAREEFIQATVYVHKETKIYLPKILCYYGKDMSIDIAALLEAVGECLVGIQWKAVKTCVKGRPEKHVYWLEQTSSFRYLIHKEMAAQSKLAIR